MTPTAWADLPNAKHIDRILDDLKKNPDNWSDARGAARNATKNDARYAAWNAARGDARNDARNAAWYATKNAARADARADARDAISALVAYDDCAYLLDEKPEHVQMLGLLGNEKALLLYQACLALQKEIV